MLYRYPAQHTSSGSAASAGCVDVSSGTKAGGSGTDERSAVSASIARFAQSTSSAESIYTVRACVRACVHACVCECMRAHDLDDRCEPCSSDVERAKT